MDTSFCVCLSNESYHHHLAAQHAELAPISSSEPAVSLPSTVVLDQVQVAVLCVVDFQQADSPARRFDDGVEGPVLLHQIPMVLKKTPALPGGGAAGEKSSDSAVKAVCRPEKPGAHPLPPDRRRRGSLEVATCGGYSLRT